MLGKIEEFKQTKKNGTSMLRDSVIYLIFIYIQALSRRQKKWSALLSVMGAATCVVVCNPSCFNKPGGKT